MSVVAVRRRGRKVRLWLSLGLALGLLATLGGTSVYGFTTSVSQTLLKSKCVQSPAIKWRGGSTGTTTIYPYTAEPHGTVTICYYKYQLSSKGADGDYYGVELQSTWTPAGSDFPYDPAYMSQYISSDTASKDQVYASTPTFTSSHSCSTGFSVGINIGIFSISTTPKVCSGYKVNAISSGISASLGHTWTMTQVNYVRHIDLGFVQKVKHGVVPTYKVGFQIPFYIYKAQTVGDPWKITPDWVYYNYTGI